MVVVVRDWQYLKCLSATLNTHGSEALSMSLLLPRVVEMLADGQSPVRDAAMETLEIAHALDPEPVEVCACALPVLAWLRSSEFHALRLPRLCYFGRWGCVACVRAWVGVVHRSSWIVARSVRRS